MTEENCKKAVSMEHPTQLTYKSRRSFLNVCIAYASTVGSVNKLNEINFHSNYDFACLEAFISNSMWVFFLLLRNEKNGRDEWLFVRRCVIKIYLFLFFHSQLMLVMIAVIKYNEHTSDMITTLQHSLIELNLSSFRLQSSEKTQSVHLHHDTILLCVGSDVFF
jgi:hypothetical protein